MARIVGYSLIYPDGKEGETLKTRAGAIKTAKEFLEMIVKRLELGLTTPDDIKTVGIVRANDRTLIMKISVGDKGYIIEKM